MTKNIMILNAKVLLKCRFLLIIPFFLLPSHSLAEIKILSRNWYGLAKDPNVKISIEGQIAKQIQNTTVQLAIGKKKWTNEIDEKGLFKFVINHDEIAEWGRTKLLFKIIKDNKIIEESSKDIYCCSDENFGFYKELVPNKNQTIVIPKQGNDLDGIQINIPKESILGKSTLFVTVQKDVAKISLSKYVILNAPISFEFTDNFQHAENIQYSLIAYPNIPRSGFGEKISVKDWEDQGSLIRKWKNIDMKKSKIIILGYDGEWKEIIPTKIVGNKIEFKLPKDHNFDRFVPVTILDPQ